ncbi:hypothetical protein [Actinoplanes sp. GCM10030250]|uniref:hypothetical protein n=1 Tax=Actinoplanes sp. GCM10030250 TaxID=3273376 RepID=UPI00361B3144
MNTVTNPRPPRPLPPNPAGHRQYDGNRDHLAPYPAEQTDLPMPHHGAAQGIFSEPRPDHGTHHGSRDPGDEQPADPTEAELAALRHEQDRAWRQARDEEDRARRQEEQRRRDGALQWQVFHRAWTLSIKHAQAAWEMRIRQPIAPYAVAFLFRQPTNATLPTHGLLEVKAATKLWLSSPETEDPADLLAAATDLVRNRDPEQPWDVRDELANRCDGGMLPQAEYLGLAMSNLNTHTGTFAEVSRAVTSQLGIPGTILFVAAEPGPQALLADRRGVNDRNRVTIHSHRALSTPQVTSPYPYLDVSLHRLYQDAVHGDLLTWMHDLDREIRAADQTRRALTTHPARRQAGPTRRDSRRRSQ